MKRIQTIFSNLHQRRKILTITSGSLIAVALGADYFLGWRAVYNVSMIAAAVIAGWDIAVRAVTSLRDRHVSIELLVTRNGCRRSVFYTKIGRASHVAVQRGEGCEGYASSASGP